MKKDIMKPRTFEHFPEDTKCPVCHTNKDIECILLEIDNTENEGICEATPTHLWCAIAKRHNKDTGIIYTKI